MALSLDGNTSFIGTEFIKLLNTGSSDLATVEYVDEQVALGGGGGNVDLSNYYTQTEVDTLLNNKLNVNNPQDITGTLRIDSTNGNGKLIVNAVGAPNDEDFYVNGLSNLGGTLKAQVIQASSNIQTSQQIQSNVINTYSNSNLIIQRNAIPYITLDSQIVDDETVEKIILMKDVEFSGGLSLNTLSVDTLNTIGLNDMVFNVATLGEFSRFQVSDNTVRVPNTRSFLSQDIYLDNLRPLTFSTDVVFNGGNNTNDAYEEYVRLDASAEKVSISKETKFENAIQLNQGQSIKWTNVFIREVQGATRPEFDLIVNGSTSHLRLWVNGAIKQAITNTTIACKVNIDAEQGLTVFTGQQLKTNTINSHTNSNLVLQRSGSTLITLNSSNQIQLSGDLSLPTSNTQYIRFPNCNIRQGVATVVYFDFNVDTATGQYRFFIDSNTILNLTPLTTTISNTLQVNTINTNGDNNLVFQRNGSPYMTFNTNRIDIDQPLHLANSLTIDTADKLTMAPSLEGGINIFDIRNTHPVVDNAMIRFRCGVGAGETIICQMTNDGISAQRNVIVGTAYELRTNAIDTTTDNDLVISRNNIPFLTLDKFIEDTVEKEAIICNKQLRANGQLRVNNLQINQFASGIQYTDFRLENANNSIMRFFVGNSTSPNLQISQYINGSSETISEISLNRTTKCGGTFHTNTIDTYTDTDLVINRNGTEALRIRASDNLILTSDTAYFSSPKVYANEYLNRTSTYDTVFYGANSTSDGRVEYMKWNRADQSLDFNAPIDNTNIAVIGNIVDTTVSDERLKTNIQDVESNYCDCVKNVKIKTFEYKDEKYKNSDKYGLIAQHLQKHLPKEFNNIVKETKPKKDEGEAYLSINYMKLSVVLWGALQETLNKVEHLEASVYELQEELKDKKKSTPKSKAKAKSKSKAKHVD